jgi:hypothetical protein
MRMVLFVGDDWAEDQHDVEVQDATGRRLGKARLPEGVAGIGRLHALIGEFTDPDEAGAGQVLVGIETDRGPWVAALVAAGYRVFAVNPMQVARYRKRGCTSGAKSDAGDAHVLADMVRTDAHQLRPVAGDTALVEGIKVVARAHQSLIWDRTRHVLRLRCALRWRPSMTWPRPTPWSCSLQHRTPRRRRGCPATGSPGRSNGLGAATSRARPSTSPRCCAPRRCASPRSWPGPTRSPSGSPSR